MYPDSEYYELNSPRGNSTSPRSDSGDTIILHDDDYPVEPPAQQKSMSFLRFISFEGQIPTPNPNLTKQAIYDTLTCQASIVMPTPSINNCSSGLSFLQSYPSLSSLFCQKSLLFDEEKLSLLREPSFGVNIANELAKFPGDMSHGDFGNCDNGILKNLFSADAEFLNEPTPVSVCPPPCLLTAMKTAADDGDDETSCSSIFPCKENDRSHGSLEVNKENEIVPSSPNKYLKLKNREAAKKCRQKKKEYLKKLESELNDLKCKYSACRQENDDLKRLLFQHLKLVLPPEPSSDYTQRVPSWCPPVLSPEMPDSTASSFPTAYGNSLSVSGSSFDNLNLVQLSSLAPSLAYPNGRTLIRQTCSSDNANPVYTSSQT